MITITITEKHYELIKADLAKFFDRYLSVSDKNQLPLEPVKQEVQEKITAKLIRPVPAPVEPVAPVFPIQQDEEVDSLGVKWNPLVHSAGKTKTADGTWRMKRNIGKEEKTNAEKVAEAVQARVEPVAVVPPPAAPLPVIKPMSNGHTVESFKANLVPIFADLMHKGKLDQNYVNSLKEYFKVGEIWQIMADNQKVSELYENFCGAGLIERSL